MHYKYNSFSAQYVLVKYTVYPQGGATSLVNLNVHILYDTSHTTDQILNKHTYITYMSQLSCMQSFRQLVITVITACYLCYNMTVITL